MSQAYTDKNIKLSLEFDEYAAKHPELFDRIPNGAYLIMTKRGDEAFNAYSRALVKNIKRQPIVEAYKLERGWRVRPLASVS